MNIVEPILFQARYHPGAPALCELGKNVVSYAALRAQMNNVARRAVACGLKRGSSVALSTNQPMVEAVLILRPHPGRDHPGVSLDVSSGRAENRRRDRHHQTSICSSRATSTTG